MEKTTRWVVIDCVLFADMLPTSIHTTSKSSIENLHGSPLRIPSTLPQACLSNMYILEDYAHVHTIHHPRHSPSHHQHSSTKALTAAQQDQKPQHQQDLEQQSSQQQSSPPSR